MARVLACLLLAACAATAADADQAAKKKGDPPKNVVTVTTAKDYDERIAAAKGKPVIVVADFWATWCPPCVKLSAELDKLARRHPDRLIVLRIDVDQADELRKRFDIENVSLPLVVKYQDGEEKGRESGFVNAAVLEKWLQLPK